MTLIASTLNHKMPIIISDLLWSGDHTPEPVRFPTNNFDPTPYLPEDQEAKPVKLGQKMYFISIPLANPFIFYSMVRHNFVVAVLQWRLFYGR